MKILAIETSCDETCSAVTKGSKILSNVIWSQTAMHAKFGGVMPSVAKRAHEERIDDVVEAAIKRSGSNKQNIDAVAVTIGPGLAIALGVGIRKAKELALDWNKPLIPVNHVEGHALSPLAGLGISEINELKFPCMAMVVSGGTTQLILVKDIGNYRIVAETVDDAVGEGLDKAARLLGLGYPGGAVLEKMAKLGNPKTYLLPLPMAGREDRNEFSYSGLKTAFVRLVNQLKDESLDQTLGKQQIYDLGASYQNRAFEHLLRISKKTIEKQKDLNVQDLLIGGGVAANVELRKRLRQLGKELGIRVWFPYSKKLYGDNAAMIGIAAEFKLRQGSVEKNLETIDRSPRARIDQGFT